MFIIDCVRESELGILIADCFFRTHLAQTTVKFIVTGSLKYSNTTLLGKIQEQKALFKIFSSYFIPF